MVENVETTEKVALTKAQKAFLDFCRELGFGRISEVIVRDGEPKTLTTVVKTVRLD